MFYIWLFEPSHLVEGYGRSDLRNRSEQSMAHPPYDYWLGMIGAVRIPDGYAIPQCFFCRECHKFGSLGWINLPCSTKYRFAMTIIERERRPGDYDRIYPAHPRKKRHGKRKK